MRRRQPQAGSDEWLEFDGGTNCGSILAGVGSVEELRIPARNFSGLGLRLRDLEKKVWADHWVNTPINVMTTPGVQGQFLEWAPATSVGGRGRRQAREVGRRVGSHHAEVVPLAPARIARWLPKRGSRHGS